MLALLSFPNITLLIQMQTLIVATFGPANIVTFMSMETESVQNPQKNFDALALN